VSVVLIEAWSIGCVLIGPVDGLSLSIKDNSVPPISFKGKQTLGQPQRRFRRAFVTVNLALAIGLQRRCPA
jgi:hypothetical protein